MQSHFDLFQLPAQFELDLTQLDRAFREVQAQVHPDKFVGKSSAEQRVAMQWATRANEAYQTLKNPLKRASYLCELHGVSLNTESNTAMPAEFLMQQMAWREELSEAKNDAATLLRLTTQVRSEQDQQIRKMTTQLAENNFQDAAQSVRQSMFLEKLRDELDECLVHER